MTHFSSNTPLALLLVVATLATRATIPEGYMPSAPGTGFLYELCPSAVPAEVMRVLQARRGPSAHAHHGHHGHHADTSGEPADHTVHDGAQCPIGHLLASAVAIDMSWEADALPPAPEFEAAPVIVRLRSLRTATSSRGPPA
ncbi:MAG: hypothetical protein QNJ07_12190 [Woeseiaceae bacterium]|nr:hypothetical protein [Woeseiaceae bacterium]